MDLVGIIPARWASTRFPGKPLVEINGKPMIRWVYEKALLSQTLSDLVVATDDDRIAQTVMSFGGKVVMTLPEHPSGTDRCHEALTKLEQKFAAVINIQGDEPMLNPRHIDLLAKLISKPSCEIATLVSPIEKQEDLFDPNVVKAVVAQNGHVLYFSRQALPHVRGIDTNAWLRHSRFFRHLGMYAYTSAALRAISKLQVSPLEKAESLEQLRWLENGFRIEVGIVDGALPGVDVPADVDKLKKFL